MTNEQESRSLTQADSRMAALGGVGAHPLQQVASRLGDHRDGRSRLRAKDLVGLLLCHGARAWRASQPTTHIHLRIGSGANASAVRIAYGMGRRQG